MEPTKQPVLIVGAGPTGLMLACELARRGVDFRIVDGKAGPTRESRALGVQARTLELWASLGIADAAVAAGRPIVAANVYVGRRHVQRLPLGDIGSGLTPFPFVLVLEQSRNEELLVNKLRSLGHAVEWHTELADFDDQADGVHAVLRHADGGSESLQAGWLVGCDGAKSRVRERLGLAFTGGTYENAFYVADTRVDWALPHGELTACFSRETFVLFFPMPGEQRYRVIGILPRDGEGEPELRFEDIEAAVRAQMDVAVRFSDTAWFSAYRVHHRSVERFRAGHCFVAGDAAHVHSPVGAQGMNTGLQDAANLAWKLALVAEGRAGEALLDSYHAERWPFAQRLLASTDRAFRAVISQRPLLRGFRLHVFPWLASRLLARQTLRRRLFRLVSQTGLHYRGSALSGGVAGRLAVRAGDRLPHAVIGAPLAEPPLAVHAWLARPELQLLMMQVAADDGLQALATDWRERLQQLYPGCLRVQALSADSGGADELFASLGVRQRALLLVRPDQYIAWAGEAFDFDALRAHLEGALALRPAI